MKNGLQEMKQMNINLLIRQIAQDKDVSRIDLVKKTGLSPATVTSLVSHLLEQEIVVETGINTNTGGRAKKMLALNANYANILVFSISRKSLWVRNFDFTLNEVHKKCLASSFVSGNDLLELIMREVKALQNVIGIGLLFQDDMKESDFMYMFDTGNYAEQIPLKQALSMRTKAKISEAYEVKYTISDAVKSESEDQNVAFIRLGEKTAAHLILENHPVSLKEEFCEAFTKNELAVMIMTLCTLFHLTKIVIEGEVAAFDIKRVKKELMSKQTQLPTIELLKNDMHYERKLAIEIRSLLFV